MIQIKQFVKSLTPPIVIKIYRALCRGGIQGVQAVNNNRLYLSGDYASWNQAMADSTGYDSEIILEKTKNALLKVKSGEASYERDSILFDEIDYAWPMLAGLMWASAHSSGILNVLDFGGSLGSTYFQNRTFLSALPGVRWNIVEQARHVEVGKAWFEDDRLRFYTNIEDCLADTQPNVALLSSVLQYLEHPYAVFEQILGLSYDCVVIDRTPFWSGTRDYLCVQSVPSKIYPASYPSWIFSRQRLFALLEKDWEVMVTFDNPDRLTGPIDFSYQGAIIVRRNHLS